MMEVGGRRSLTVSLRFSGAGSSPSRELASQSGENRQS